MTPARITNAKKVEDATGLKNNQAVVFRPPPDLENSLIRCVRASPHRTARANYFFFSPFS